MRVRMKSYAVVGVVVDEGKDHYIVRCGTDKRAWHKDSCEPVPEEQWVDVTGECEVDTFSINNVGMPHSSKEWTFTHNGKRVNAGYRLRKVGGWIALKGSHASIPTTAFIVEMKVPE